MKMEMMCPDCKSLTPDHLAQSCLECGCEEVLFLDVCDWCGEEFRPDEPVVDHYHIVALKWRQDFGEGVTIARGIDAYHERCVTEEREQR